MAETGYSRWRWFLGVILLLGVLGESLLWFAPSPAVSYTHLDVYKRQVQFFRKPSKICVFLCNKNK